MFKRMINAFIPHGSLAKDFHKRKQAIPRSWERSPEEEIPATTLALLKAHEERMRSYQYIASEQHYKDLDDWLQKQSHTDTKPPWEDDDDDGTAPQYLDRPDM